MTETYQRFYSASDTQVVISNLDDTKMLTLDLATGVGFKESADVIPVYSLNNITPSFFVKGNSIVNGFIALAFKYEKYLKKSILHVNSIDQKIEPVGKISTFDDIKRAIANKNNEKSLSQDSSMTTILSPFNMSIIMTTDNVDGKFESVKIFECYLTGRSLSTTSDGESPLSEGFTFIAKMILWGEYETNK